MRRSKVTEPGQDLLNPANQKWMSI